jgi:hypothetical protein
MGLWRQAGPKLNTSNNGIGGKKADRDRSTRAGVCFAGETVSSNYMGNQQGSNSGRTFPDRPSGPLIRSDLADAMPNIESVLTWPICKD